MKILYWTPLFWPEPGGIEVLAQKMVTALRDRGHQLHVLASHGSIPQPDETAYEGIPIRRLHFWKALSRRDPGLIVSIHREIAAIKKDFQPDIVHSNFSGYTSYFQLAGMATSQAPLLLALHSSLGGKKTGADTVLGNLLFAADWVSAVSQSTLDDALVIAGGIVDRPSVIYNGLTPGDSAPSPLPWDEPRLMVIGRLAPEKGFDLAITALKLLRKNFPRLILLIVGDGPQRATLQRQAINLGLEEAVEFAGNVPNQLIAGLLNRATIVLIPSRCRESFSLAAVEAAQMGRPVVAAASGGLQEVVLDGKTGLLFEMENSQSLATAVGTLLADREMAMQMGENGRKRARTVFAFEPMILKYETLYQQLICAKQRTRKAEVRP